MNTKTLLYQKFSMCLLKLVFCLYFGIGSGFAVLIADVDWGEGPSSIARRDIMSIDDTRPPRRVLRAQEEELGGLSFQKHIRVIFFDTDQQRFVESNGEFPGTIYYFSLLEEPQDRNFTIPGWFNIKYEAKSQSVSLDLISLQPHESKTKIVRSRFEATHYLPIQRVFDDVVQSEEESLRYIVGLVSPNDPYPNTSYTLSGMMEFFAETTPREKTRNTKLTWLYRFYDPLDNLEKKWLGEFNTVDSEYIGELAADMTMQWLGFHKKVGKYGTNNGFDGVYDHHILQNALVLSEAKLHKKALSVPSIMRGLYSSIQTRIAKLKKNDFKVVAKYIDDFMEKNPENIYLQSYICISDGQVKSDLKPLLAVQGEITPLKPNTKPLDVTPTLAAPYREIAQLTPLPSEEDKIGFLANVLDVNFHGSSLEEVLRITTLAYKQSQEQKARCAIVPNTPGPRCSEETKEEDESSISPISNQDLEAFLQDFFAE